MDDIGDLPILPSNPWFETTSGQVEFGVFQARLETIGRWLTHITPAVAGFLEAEREEFSDTVENTPAEWAWDNHDAAREDLYWAEELLPILAFGSVLPACFAAIEMLCADLVEVCEMRGVASYASFEGGKGAPAVERQRLYFERAAGWAMTWPVGERRQFERLLNVRNKVAHSLGEGLSSEALRDLAELMEWTDGKLRWEPRLVEAALFSVGELARVIEDGMLANERGES